MRAGLGVFVAATMLVTACGGTAGTMSPVATAGEATLQPTSSATPLGTSAAVPATASPASRRATRPGAASADGPRAGEQGAQQLAYIPDHDTVPSGRLRLTPLSGWAVHQKAFADTKTIRLEDRLPVVLQELELRAAAQEERDRQIEAERQERRRRWRHVRDEAEVAVRQAHRAGILRQQVENWQLANQVDAYLASMVDRIAVLDGDEQAAATEWIAWAREYQTRLDPLNGPLAIPADPRFTPDALAPFMRGLR